MSYNELKEIRRHGDNMMPITYYEYRAPKGIYPMHCHWHNEMELFKLIEGRVKVQCDNNFFWAEPGMIMFFAPGEIHSCEPIGDEEICFRSIVFHPDIICDRDIIRSKYINPIISGKSKAPSVLNPKLEIDNEFNKLYDTLAEAEFGYELMVKSLVFSMFYKISKETINFSTPLPLNPSVESIKSSMEYIQENYKNPITIDELSSMSNMSQGHYCRLFKQYTLKTPVQYINNIRIAKATELLISSNRKILDIALDTGFNSLSYFIGVFKEGVGITPTKFRKDYGKKQKK